MVEQSEHIKLPKFYFSFQALWLRFTGIEIMKATEKLLYRIYSFAVMAFVAVFVGLEYVELKFHSDFNTIGIILIYWFTHTLTMVKVVVIYKNRKEIGNLMRSFHEGFYIVRKRMEDKFEEQCIYEILDKSRFQMTLYGLSILLSYTSAELSSLETRLTKPPEEWLMPFAPISLVDITRPQTFTVAYIYQTVAMYYMVMWIYLCDCTVISIMAQTGGQLKILEHRIRKYKSPALGSMDSRDSLHYTLKHHLCLLETVDKVEFLCSYLVLCVFLADMFLLCLEMYFTSMTRIRSIDFVRYVGYTVVIGVQIFLYCWWGNEMTLANDKLAVGISETYNVDDPIGCAKALELMLVKAQKPLFFTAGKFVPLSVDTFKGIMKASFSYFTVLRQMNSK